MLTLAKSFCINEAYNEFTTKCTKAIENQIYFLKSKISGKLKIKGFKMPRVIQTWGQLNKDYKLLVPEIGKGEFHISNIVFQNIIHKYKR